MNCQKWSVTEVLDLLLECGRIGMHYYAKNESWLKKDQTLVTAADGEIEALIGQHTNQPDQGSWMLGEETADDQSEEYLASVLRQRAWIVDPIDGTAPFAHRLAYWGTSLGLIEGGRFLEGAVILPQQGEVFISNGADVFFAENVDVYADRTAVDLCLLVPRPLPLTDGGMVAISQKIAKTGRFNRPNPVHATGCAVSSLLYLMLGRYLAYFGHLKLWDLAGALPLLRKTGFEAFHFDGRPLTDVVDETHYVLGRGAPDRWAVRGGALFTARGLGPALLPTVELDVPR